jgi:hypothetical protein
MYLLFYGAVCNGFEVCNIITRGIGRGGALKIETFSGSLVPFGPKNLRHQQCRKKYIISASGT